MQMTDPLLALPFAALAIIVQFAFLIGVYIAYRERPNVAIVFLVSLVGSALWMMGTFLAAAKGLLRFDTRPPTMLLLVVVMFAISFWIGSSRFGKELSSLPLVALIGFQAFRLPLELLMHRAYRDGIMPVQMTYTGRNFDIVTGAAAGLIALAMVFTRVPLRIMKTWNILGIMLLTNVLVIAMLSMPTPIRRFHNEPANTWVAQAPYVWLPTVFVLAAIAGHIVISRKLYSEASVRQL
jgi:hypothetical protein